MTTLCSGKLTSSPIQQKTPRGKRSRFSATRPATLLYLMCLPNGDRPCGLICWPTQMKPETPLESAMATVCFFGCLALGCLLLFAFQ